MRKYISMSITVILACIFLCACGRNGAAQAGGPAGDDKEVPIGSTAEAAAEAAARPATDGSTGKEELQSGQPPERKAEDLVGLQYQFQGQLGSEEMGYLIDADYSVPEILSDSDGARAINEEIRAFCIDVIEPTEEELDYPTWYRIGYEAYLNGDILSLVVTKNCTTDDVTCYAVFNYDAQVEGVLDNAGLLAFCGYTEQSFTDAMRRAAAYEADTDMQSMFEAFYWNSGEVSDSDRQLMYAENMRLRQNTISAGRVGLEMPMYLDEAGQLKVVTEMDTTAGAGFYNCILSPRTESAAKDMEFGFEDSLFITYRGGRMKIRFEEGDWTRNTFGGDGSYLEFGKEYPVEGVYKDYVDGGMMLVCGGEYAIPVFVSDDGMVSALNIYACAPAGYFCMTEPVMGLTGMEAITEENADLIAENVGAALIWQCPGLAKRALDLYGLEGFEKIYAEGGEEDGIYGYYIGFDEDDEGTFLYQQYLSGLGYAGECILLGMNEDGLVFGARLYAVDSLDTDCHYGAFSLKKYSRWEEAEEDILSWAEFRELGGYTFFEGEEEIIELKVTYG